MSDNSAVAAEPCRDTTVEEVRLSRLRRSLARRLRDESVQIAPFREGVDCYVDTVTRAAAAPAVVRSAKVERLMTSYEGLVDFGDVLLKEVAVAGLLASAGVPIPRLLAWHRTEDVAEEPSWMLSDRVEHPAVETLPAATQYELGRIARTIHSIVPDASAARRLVPSGDWERWIVDRIVQRLDAARTYMPLPPSDAIRPRLAETVRGRSAMADRLLHLDLRAPNLALDGDRIVAVFDFANAICGDPYLEIARIRECGLLTDAFLEGYGLTPLTLAAHERLLQVYGLDLTALLVVVSKEEFDDPALHHEMSIRTGETVGSLLSVPGARN